MPGTLGWVFYRKGLYGQARESLVRGVAEDRGNTRRNAVVRKYHLAMAYAKLGETRKARDVLAEALRQNPDLPEANLAEGAFDEAAKQSR